MKSVNRCTLLGNVGKDPEVKYTAGGTPVAKFSLATNERFKDKSGEWQDRTEWHALVAFGKLAEIVGQHVHKGNQLFAEGKIQTRSWDKDGIKHFMTEINLTDVTLLGKAGHDAPSESSVDTKEATQGEDIPF